MQNSYRQQFDYLQHLIAQRQQYEKAHDFTSLNTDINFADRQTKTLLYYAIQLNDVGKREITTMLVGLTNL